MQNINKILDKQFETLTREEQKQIVECLRKRMLAEFSRNDRQGIYATTQKLMAYNSNKIEGGTLTPDQTASLFDTGTILAGNDVFRAKDIEEMSGHFSMFNEMLKTLDLQLSEPLIKAFHYRLKAGVFEDYANGYVAGEYKRIANTVSNITTSRPNEVHETMERLLGAYNEKIVHDLLDLVKFHATFEKIHPFQDGNGRTGRMILIRESLENGLIPVIVKDEYKIEYYHALHRAQVEDEFGELVEFFRKAQSEYFSVLKEFLHVYDSHEKTNIKELLKEAAKQKR